MSTIEPSIYIFPCLRWRDDTATCVGCDWKCEHAVPPIRVYRPQRRAVVQSLQIRIDRGAWPWTPRIALQSRLGCEHARTMMRFYRRNANGTRLGRWSWARKPRAFRAYQYDPFSGLHYLQERF